MIKTATTKLLDLVLSITVFYFGCKKQKNIYWNSDE